LKDLLAERSVAVSHETVWRFLRRQGRSFKKSGSALMSSGDGTAGDARAAISMLPSIVDTGAKLALLPPYSPDLNPPLSRRSQW
jgi:hypothetical protein